ncbi:hypothetical protein ASG89_20215 [Paenibacillus sp. Soil766]|uniref:response regulator n=1 Tax=Paenibacillus sp. Soil766 TaxID=1736404 RepID=UPI00070B20A2|nr:response regulator [Paenibacillus sp. Soil766]KRF06068.1 hypothetical protein ASG89_20215 [Paenibacillus sp. Soil766]
MNRVITMVVIDDITTVVNGIAERIQWQKYGIAVVGTAFNGDEGLKLIQRTKPDIIITDIRMPKLSGIEMVENVVSILPDSKVIFISGYSDFDHAQHAIQLGAFDYVLKPFMPDQIMNIVFKARDLVLQQSEQQSNVLEMERKLRESMPLLRQEYLSLLVRYHSNPQTLKKRWDFLQIDMKEESLAVHILEIDQFNHTNMHASIAEIELARFALQNIIEETIHASTKGIVFRDGINRMVCMLNCSSSEESLEIAEKYCDNIRRYTKNSISVGVGMTVDHIVDLPLSFQQALTALSYTFYTIENSIFYYGDIAQILPVEGSHYSEEKEKELIYGIRSGNVQKTNEVLEGIFAEWDYLEQKPTPEKTKTLYLQLILAIDKSITIALDQNEEQPIAQFVQELNKLSLNVRDIQNFVRDICDKYCVVFQGKQQVEAEITITKSIQYIKDHLHINETVNDYAKQVHLSSSYYSNLFKKVTGTSVLQFVVNEKVEKAKLLMVQGLSLSEVAEAVGYEERSYFSDVFKKKTGITPTEFKQQYVMKK